MGNTAIPRLLARIESLMGDRQRLIIAIAGPPGAGKSTISGLLVTELNAGLPDGAIVVPMDGYHYDNEVLHQRGLHARKGAPETFNVAGLLCDLQMIRKAQFDVAIPVFDRAADLARANAAIVTTNHRIIIVEGNYLLLDRPIWREIAYLFDLKVMISVDEMELMRRLTDRWLQHGHDRISAEKRAYENDLVNARVVIDESQAADLLVHQA